MSVDLSQIETTVVSLAATALGIVGTWAVSRLAQRFGLQVNQAQKAMFDQALSDSLTYGVTQADATIKAKGWDHVDSKNAIIDAGLSYVVAKFPDALKAVGLSSNLNDPANAAAITSALTRMLPIATTTAAASPTTPPSPTSGPIVTTTVPAP